MNRDIDFRQLEKLGEMMGDGLHHEPGGEWISREYKKLAKALIPEIAQAERKRSQQKAIHTNEQLAKLLLTRKCDCGGQLKQSRSGSRVCYCTVCNSRYKARTKKK